MAPVTNYGGYATADQALDEVVNRLAGALNPSRSTFSAAGRVEPRAPIAISTSWLSPAPRMETRAMTMPAPMHR